MSLDLTEDLAVDPYPYYERLREAPIQPVRRPDGLEVWLVSRYEEARTVLSDPRFSTQPRYAEEALRRAGVLVGGDIALGQSMLTSDPPDHTRLRRLVTKAFTPQRIERLRPWVQELTDGLLDRIEPLGEVDLVETFALPLPVTVMCELLGVPAEDWDRFSIWVQEMMAIAVTDEDRARGRPAAIALHRYLAELVATRRAHIRADEPEQAQPDLVSALIIARDEGGQLSEQELVGTVTLLLVAGQETTVNLIANGMLALFRHPDQLTLLKQRPALLSAAIDELLRYDGPAQQTTFRITLEDVEVGGVTIPAGSVVSVVLGAADRDPRRYVGPDRLDITRTDSQHLAFGHGIHYCMGAPLARMEGQIAIGTLLRRFPHLALACAPDDIRWRRGSMYRRRLVNLPVRFTPSASATAQSPTRPTV